ncbi:MAG: hypothetical protein ABIF17_01545 [Patescibacteria group bacterium]
MTNNNLSDYEKAKLLRASRKNEDAEDRDEENQDSEDIKNMPDKVENEQQTKQELGTQIRSAVKMLAGNKAQLAKEVTKKAAKWLAKSAVTLIIQAIGAIFSFIIGTIEIWGPVLVILLIVLMAVFYTCDIADSFPILKPLIKWATKIDCDAMRQKQEGGISGGAGASGEYKQTWEAQGCKSLGEDNAIGGEGCGGDCKGFQPASNIKNSQCFDASPALMVLLECMGNKLNQQPASYPHLKKSDIVLTSISDDNGLSRCRDNYSKPPCFHTNGSCHYGHGNKDGSYAADIRSKTLSSEQRAELELLVGHCQGNFFDETNVVESPHYHISASACGAI